jgi:hypothetical protein
MSDQVSMDVLALEARRVYCMHMRSFNRSKGQSSNYGKGKLARYDGTSSGRPRPGEAVLSRDGKDYKPVWPRIAETVSSNRVTILELIRAQFATVSGGAPSASACYGDRAVRLTVQRREQEKQEVLNLLNSYRQVTNIEVTRMRDFLTSEQSVVDIIAGCDVSPFYKVNTIMFMSDSAFIDPLIIGLAEEDYLMRMDVYEAVWAKSIHTSFRDLAINSLRRERASLFISTDNLIL